MHAAHALVLGYANDPMRPVSLWFAGQLAMKMHTSEKPTKIRIYFVCRQIDEVISQGKEVT